MYNLTLDENGHFSKKNQPKKPCVFHAHVFNQNKYPFGQHLSQVEPFAKPWFVVMKIHLAKIEKMFFYKFSFMDVNGSTLCFYLGD